MDSRICRAHVVFVYESYVTMRQLECVTLVGREPVGAAWDRWGLGLWVSADACTQQWVCLHFSKGVGGPRSS